MFDLDQKEKAIAKLEKQSVAPDFWDDGDEAKKILQQITQLKSWTEAWDELEQELEDADTLLELAAEEEDDATLQETGKMLAKIEDELADLEFRNMLGGEDDHRNALLVIHPGAGGTESMDWAGMLLRMYNRWIESRGFQAKEIDYQQGDLAGIKSATYEVSGEYAYGYLKAEIGVHRLVRLSPFDANQRRHTSFASVFVYPLVDDDIEIEIVQSDLRIDTYRASGAGGQHVNKTDSAVRITHTPTGIVVTSQAERSQHRNRENAMKILKARLYQLKKEEEEKRLDEIEAGKREIAWGSQIRSYVFHPYKMVKDLRTEIETSDVQSVMDGEIDKFIRGYLMAQNQIKSS
ncbi:peptide chain release factor 2 [candidate division LCP-89 bacterium B3_LCP]|uniref:Peptide chain release factor 2 n=1 Tax=candidate division LCP-89 bacterium B3_LCP TaxID=2012998 RepID=A0A532URM7_UNCL8|nr:MAG: peptide chain release factor 2 [candidate division LCP-89 bacterium B3_LCP]